MRIVTNGQPVERRVSSPLLSVHSIFYTIQGEGPFCGTPATFIRLAGCNLQCPMCDTDYTTGRRDMSVDEILQTIKGRSPGLVVLTGGEPLRQDIKHLLLALFDNGFYTQIETNGVLPPPLGVYFNKNPDERSGFYLICSPKAGRVNQATASAACAFKYVMSSESVAEDGLPVNALEADAKVARPPEGWKGPIYLQPMDEGCPCQDCARLNKNHTDACIASCLTHGYILQLQIHKIIGLP